MSPVKRVNVQRPVSAEGQRALISALRLWTAADWIRSSYRGMARLKSSCQRLEGVDEADYYSYFFAAAGAAGEAAKIIRKNETGSLSRVFVENDPALAAVWEKTNASPLPREVKILMRIRDKCWAHWDECISEQWIASIADGTNDVPIMESAGKSDNSDTWSPWVRESWFWDLQQELHIKSGEELVEIVHELSSFVREVLALTQHLAASIAKSAEITFVQAD